MGTTDQEILEIVRGIPEVQRVLAERFQAQDGVAFTERVKVLDALESGGKEKAQIERAIKAQQPRSDAAYAAYQVEYNKLRELSDRRNRLQAEESILCGRLGELGEGRLHGVLLRIDDARNTMRNVVAWITTELATGQYSWHGKKQRESARAERNLLEAKRRLAAFDKAYVTAQSWIAARIHPREQEKRVENLMASLPVSPEELNWS